MNTSLGYTNTFDILLLVLIIGSLGITIGTICIGYFILINAGSKTEWVTFTTLIGAIVILGFNIGFDLKGMEESELISVEYTYDFKEKVVRQWQYPFSLGYRYATEIMASETLFNRRPEIFNSLPSEFSEWDKTLKDLTLFSIIAYIQIEKHDWQSRKETIGHMTRTINTSKPNECTRIKNVDVRNLLEKIGNYFFDSKNLSSYEEICLPPRTTFSIYPKNIMLRNPFVEIKFELQEEVGWTFLSPYPSTTELQNSLYDERRFANGTIGIKITRKMLSLRAQNPEFNKYDTWSRDIVEGARAWFESTKNDSDLAWFEAGSSHDLTGVFSGWGEGQFWIKGGKIYYSEPP